MAKQETKLRFTNIIQAIFIIILGVIIAISGGGAALDIYLGVSFLVGGVALFVLAVVALANTKVLPFGLTFLGCALLTLGIATLANWLSFGLLIALVVYLIIALGAALVIHGVVILCQKNTVMGVGEVVMGLIMITLGILYLTVPEFQVAFWIIIGILVAVYGVYSLVIAIAKK